MTRTTSETITTSDVPLLTTLRALAAEPNSDAAIRHAADRQAEILRDWLLPIAPEQLSASITALIPTIRISYVNDMPSSGISFWGRGQWHIHVRAGDRIELQMFTIMHEVKHIIDHPVCRRSNHRGGVNWEGLANHFAAEVLVIDAVHLTKIEEGR